MFMKDNAVNYLIKLADVIGPITHLGSCERLRKHVFGAAKLHTFRCVWCVCACVCANFALLQSSVLFSARIFVALVSPDHDMFPVWSKVEWVEDEWTNGLG